VNGAKEKMFTMKSEKVMLQDVTPLFYQKTGKILNNISC